MSDNEEAIWQAVANAGIVIRPDFSQPELWVSATRWGQYGPFPTRVEALGAAIRTLSNRNQQKDDAEEERDRRDFWDRLFGALG
ncbi:MAG: hypothetical protein OHK0022_23480 [Roseiflexaceae bacterium]